MKVEKMNNNSINGAVFGSNPIKDEAEIKASAETAKTGQEAEQSSKGYSGKTVGGAVLATALAATALAGGIVRGKCKTISELSKEASGLKRQVSHLQNETSVFKGQVSDLTNEADRLEGQVKDLTGKNTDLRAKNSKLQEVNSSLEKQIEDAKKKLSEIFEGGGGVVSEDDAKILKRVKAEIDTKTLDYDINNPPRIGIKEFKVDPAKPKYSSVTVGTQYRAYIKELNIPEITDGHFDFKLPDTEQMKIVKCESRDFKPRKWQVGVSEDYAESLRWDNDKIARDLLQNFYDGHGQTLDGVRMKFEPAGNGRYKVRIEGQSTYSVDKAIIIGKSTKRDDANAAGNYGEGLKMATLKLLKDKGANNVTIASDNWKVKGTLEKVDICDDKLLTFDINKVDKYDGNYVEFETDDADLLQSLRKTINRFSNSGNTHFKCPEFENGTFGIKLLDENEKGAIYIAGQRFEFNNDYDGLKGVAMFLKEKPPKEVLDISRDRTSLNDSDLVKIAAWLAEKGTTNNSERLQVIKTLDRYMDKKTGSLLDPETSMDKFLAYFVRSTYYMSNGLDRGVNFPENCVAAEMASPDVILELRSNGYRICKDGFAKIGMRKISDLLGEARKHTPVTPDETQQKKINIIREAIAKLSPSLEKHFDADEINPKIYLFNRFGASENRTYRDTLAEAIIDNEKSKGFWLDKTYLNSASFSDVLETALHEMSHKAGGDYTSEFSYKLTNVNRDALSEILNNPKNRQELQALNILWKTLSIKAE